MDKRRGGSAGALGEQERPKAVVVDSPTPLAKISSRQTGTIARALNLLIFDNGNNPGRAVLLLSVLQLVKR